MFAESEFDDNVLLGPCPLVKNTLAGVLELPGTAIGINGMYIVVAVAVAEILAVGVKAGVGGHVPPRPCSLVVVAFVGVLVTAGTVMGTVVVVAALTRVLGTTAVVAGIVVVVAALAGVRVTTGMAVVILAAVASAVEAAGYSEKEREREITREQQTCKYEYKNENIIKGGVR